MEDSKIIEFLFARNEAGIKHMDDTYGRRLFVLADNIVRNGQDAEESVSDTYLKAWNTIPPKSPTHLFAYLAKICRNFALKKLDWKTAAKRNAEVVCLTQEMESCIPDRRREGDLDRMELRRILEEFLESLPRESRLIFLRRYLYVDTVAQIAQRYGISESKVKTQLHRTRGKLRAALAKEGIAV